MFTKIINIEKIPSVPTVDDLWQAFHQETPDTRQKLSHLALNTIRFLLLEDLTIPQLEEIEIKLQKIIDLKNTKINGKDNTPTPYELLVRIKYAIFIKTAYSSPDKTLENIEEILELVANNEYLLHSLKLFLNSLLIKNDIKPESKYKIKDFLKIINKNLTEMNYKDAPY